MRMVFEKIRDAYGTFHDIALIELGEFQPLSENKEGLIWAQIINGRMVAAFKANELLVIDFPDLGDIRSLSPGAPKYPLAGIQTRNQTRNQRVKKTLKKKKTHENK